MADFTLYAYQEEVVERALQKENIIIWLPTGGGKTRAAVYVAKRHLETTPNAKVVVLVNKVHLVDQHYEKEFKPKLGNRYSLAPVSGACDERDFFGVVMQSKDVVICTAQILYNSLTDQEEAKHVDLSDITLLIIDECHHTHKETVYNKIMRVYVEKKLKGDGPLPQILGLTASPGTGGAKILHKAVEHVLQVGLHVDPFGDHLKWMMTQIHEFMNLSPDVSLRELGTQEYEADVVILEQRGVREDNRVMAQCAIHLRQYNDALLINDTLLMMDAYRSLADFYHSRFNPFDGTDIFLLGLFEENEVELRKLASNPHFENPKMDKLESILLEQFSSSGTSKGILFSKTRKSTHCLNDWIRKNPAMTAAGIKAAILIGAGNGNTHMTQNEQADTIRNFRINRLNLLISTSVAEEGLDIPECNFVVRYGLLTNEIAQQQASGRARARDSRYSVVAQEGGREVNRELINEYLEKLTGEAIDSVQRMSDNEFRKKITDLQMQAVLATKLQEKSRSAKNSRFPASSVQLLCRNCFEPVASGSDIKVLETIYANVNPDFKRKYKVGGQVMIAKTFDDWEPGCKISCDYCNKEWGYEVNYKKKLVLPNLAIKYFALETPEGRVTVKRWKDVPFTVEKFNFQEYCQDNFPDLFD
uniref:RNA helicase n=1 Tax=Gouania willdenowi TaxID=441366 RepID=A0A8C5D5X5_GOUWI